jgi:hypothetical protein
VKLVAMVLLPVACHTDQTVPLDVVCAPQKT